MDFVELYFVELYIYIYIYIYIYSTALNTVKRDYSHNYVHIVQSANRYSNNIVKLSHGDTWKRTTHQYSLVHYYQPLRVCVCAHPNITFLHGRKNVPLFPHRQNPQWEVHFACYCCTTTQDLSKRP